MTRTGISRRYGLQIIVLAGTVLIFALTTPSFRGPSGAYATLESLTLLGIAAAGLAVTLIAGEFDLSVGSTAMLSGILAIQFADLGLVASVLLSVGSGVVLGFTQGYLIARLGINSMVFTIGTSILISGVAWLAAGGRPVVLTDFSSSDLLLTRWLVFSPASLTGVCVLIAVGFFLAQSRRGREIYAVGGARQEATAAGVPVRKALTTAFTISGGCAAMAGALTSIKSASAAPDGFSSLLLTAAAACLIGGISLYGGRGDIVNVILGVLTLGILSAGLAANGAQSFVTELVTGTLLLLVITVEIIISRVLGKRKLKVMAISSSPPTSLKADSLTSA